jgi:miniconductance mechanosensitive channel
MPPNDVTARIPLLARLEAWTTAQPLAATAVIAAVILLVAYVAFVVTRRYLVRALGSLGRRTRMKWDEALHARGFFHRLAWAVPLLIVRAGLPFVPLLPDGVTSLTQRLVAAAMVLVVASAIGAFLNALGDVYARSPKAAARPIKGYLQGVVLVIYILAAVVMVAALIDRDPLLIIGGLGAASAVLMLVFRDTLLSLVAGIQLTSNDLIRVGDWIEMPQFNADGDVVDIALHSVTVQNWDRTFTVIPAHRFLEHSFKNWRGMQASGGRRIKRSIVLDMSSIRFLEPDEIEDLRRFVLLREYLDAKRRELEAWAAEHPEVIENPVNARRLTNIGTFRAYVDQYLKNRPDIRQDMTFLVRQLEPDGQGLPLEIYVFVADTRWAVYEAVQADVFDHLLAIVAQFGLRVFQEPSGADVRRLAPAVRG